MTNSNTAFGTITPSCTTHYLNVLETMRIKALEVFQNMERDGAGTDVLDALAHLGRVIGDTKGVLEFTKASRTQEMEAERTAKRQEREAEMATKRAERLATKAAKATAVPVTPGAVSTQPATLSDGPQGPLGLGHGTLGAALGAQ